MYALNCAWNSTILYVATWLMCLFGVANFCFAIRVCQEDKERRDSRVLVDTL